jgi:hypothetical protein
MLWRMSLFVGVCFLDKDVYLGNPFEVTSMVKKAFGKVDAVKVTRSGMLLISCVFREQNECAL